MGRGILALVAISALAGCSASSIDFDNMTAAELMAKPQWMEIRPSVPKTASIVGPVSVEICNKRRSDPVPTDTSVLNALKVEAARKGGTALADVSFRVTPEGTDSCFSYARASGIAYMRQ